MTRAKQVFEPDPNMLGHYRARYETYLDLIGAMRDFWSRAEMRKTVS
ncbi:hypothetical protein [Ruegeria sp. R14_0]|nr:hypothetical protein [Ruegeria sp. R14_0]